MRFWAALYKGVFEATSLFEFKTKTNTFFTKNVVLPGVWPVFSQCHAHYCPPTRSPISVSIEWIRSGCRTARKLRGEGTIIRVAYEDCLSEVLCFPASAYLLVELTNFTSPQVSLAAVKTSYHAYQRSRRVRISDLTSIARPLWSCPLRG